jgi:DNA-binding NarL/FixJ family response regulator
MAAIQQILIADEDAVFREGLQMVLSDYCQSVMTSGSGPKVVSLVDALLPDVVLIDPGAAGSEAAREIKSRHPNIRVILLSVFDEYLQAALDIGADGYLLKGCPTEELLAAIRRPANASETIEG